MSAAESRERQRRKKYLRPLLDLTLRSLITAIEDMPLRRLRAVLRAMDACTQTNCWWAEYELAQRFRGDVEAAIRRHERAKGSSE